MTRNFSKFKHIGNKIWSGIIVLAQTTIYTIVRVIIKVGYLWLSPSRRCFDKITLHEKRMMMTMNLIISQ